MSKYNFETLQIHAGKIKDQFGTCVTPIYQSAAYFLMIQHMIAIYLNLMRKNISILDCQIQLLMS